MSRICLRWRELLLCGGWVRLIYSFDFFLIMKRKYTIIIEKDEKGWFVSDVVELPGCHTQAKSIDQLIDRTRKAIQAYLESDEMPEISDEFVGVQQIEV